MTKEVKSFMCIKHIVMFDLIYPIDSILYFSDVYENGGTTSYERYSWVDVFNGNGIKLGAIRESVYLGLIDTNLIKEIKK